MPTPFLKPVQRLALAMTLAAPAVAAAETITLTDGAIINAPIIKQTSEAIWLDLGSDVVRIDRERVERIEASDESEAPATFAETGRLYRMVETRVERTPEQQARRFGGGVVKVATPVGTGSGFITHPDGYFVTNAHVIQGEKDIRAIVFEEEAGVIERRAIDDVEIIAVNDHFDLALLRMEHPEGEQFPWVYLQTGDELDAGEEVFAIGAPLGLERTLSSGVIATTRRSFEGIPYIQTTTQINPGNSGGPLFNLAGEVIGVTNMKIPFGEGLGFAIPARYVRDFLDNHEAFAYDEDNPNTGHTYHRGPERARFGAPERLHDR
jgi:serine protease Do